VRGAAGVFAAVCCRPAWAKAAKEKVRITADATLKRTKRIRMLSLRLYVAIRSCSL